jgi:hypothetical protein
LFPEKNPKKMKQVGIILITIGLILTIYTTVSFFTKEKVLDLGKVEVSKKEKHTVSWSPILGVILLGVGSIAVWRSSKK